MAFTVPATVILGVAPAVAMVIAPPLLDTLFTVTPPFVSKTLIDPPAVVAWRVVTSICKALAVVLMPRPMVPTPRRIKVEAVMPSGQQS